MSPLHCDMHTSGTVRYFVAGMSIRRIPRSMLLLDNKEQLKSDEAKTNDRLPNIAGGASSVSAIVIGVSIQTKRDQFAAKRRG